MRTLVMAIVGISIAFSFCSLSIAQHEGIVLIASRYSDRYHQPNCKLVSKITDEEKITFSSYEEGEKAGYTHCRLCHPKAVESNFAGQASDRNKNKSKY